MAKRPGLKITMTSKDELGLSQGLFNKRIDRLIWELVVFFDFDMIQKDLGKIVEDNAF